MTVPAQDRFTFSSGNGVTTTFPYTFMIPGTVDDPQFLVYLIEIATGTRTDLTVDVDYSISGLGVEEGGVVTYPLSGTPLAASHRLVIESNMPYEQQTDVYNSGTLYLNAIEDQFDNTTRQVQQIQDRVNRTFSVGIGYEGNYELFPVPDRLIGWNSTGTALENKQSESESAAGAYAAQLAAEAAQAAAEAAASAIPTQVVDRIEMKALDTATVKATFLKENGREGWFKWSTGDYSAEVTADTAEGIYIKANAIASSAGAWVRQYNGPAEISWFGAVGNEDGTGIGDDDTAAFDAAFTVTPSIYLPAGGYSVTRTYAARDITGPGVMYLNGTEKIVRNLPVPGSVVQSLSAVSYTNNVDLTTAIPFDNTPPRKEEGTEVIDASIAKKYKNSSVLVEFDAQVTADTAGVNATAALFVSQAADIYTDETSARRATFVTVPSANYGVPLRLVHHTHNADAAEYQYSVRVGPSANTIRLNGVSTQLRFAGASMASMRLTELGGELLTWGGAQGLSVLEGAPILASSGVPAAAPGVVHYTVSTPSGGTVTEADLTSHRYRHHTQVAEHNGNVWVANSSGGTSEAAAGQMVVVQVSAVETVAFSGPMLVMEAQSTFDPIGEPFQVGSMLGHPSCYCKHGGKLYLIYGADEVVLPFYGQRGGVFLAARECRDDKTLGPPFRVSPYEYTPMDGATAIEYDPVLGPPLFAHARIYGVWGDSYGKPVDWKTFALSGGKTYSEPTCIDVDGDGSFLLQVWRRLTAPNYEAAVRASYDGGETWTAMRKTDIPNSPSSLAGARLPDGRIALVGNLKLGRDPLYLAVFDAVYRVRDQVYAVRSGLPAAPTYPGTYKDAPSAAYPGIYVGEVYMWVSYSISKETIAVSRIPLSGL